MDAENYPVSVYLRVSSETNSKIFVLTLQHLSPADTCTTKLRSTPREFYLGQIAKSHKGRRTVFEKMTTVTNEVANRAWQRFECFPAVVIIYGILGMGGILGIQLKGGGKIEMRIFKILLDMTNGMPRCARLLNAPL